MMSRLAGLYIAKAMESVAAGTTAPASAIPARRAGDHAALDASHAPGRRPATSHRVAAAAHRLIGGLNRVRRGRRRLVIDLGELAIGLIYRPGLWTRTYPSNHCVVKVV